MELIRTTIDYLPCITGNDWLAAVQVAGKPPRRKAFRTREEAGQWADDMKKAMTGDGS